MTTKTQPTISLETLVDILINEILEYVELGDVKDIPKLKAAVTEKFVSGEIYSGNLDYAVLMYSIKTLQQTDIVHGAKLLEYVYTPFEIDGGLLYEDSPSDMLRDILWSIIDVLDNPTDYFTEEAIEYIM